MISRWIGAGLTAFSGVRRQQIWFSDLERAG